MVLTHPSKKSWKRTVNRQGNNNWVERIRDNASLYTSLWYGRRHPVIQTMGLNFKIQCWFLNLRLGKNNRCLYPKSRSIKFWAASWQNLFMLYCEQQRCRSACASASSDQRLCCSLLRSYNIYTSYVQSFKTLASLWNWAGRIESYLVANPNVWKLMRLWTAAAEPRHEKICLQRFATRQDSNRSA